VIRRILTGNPPNPRPASGTHPSKILPNSLQIITRPFAKVETGIGVDIRLSGGEKAAYPTPLPVEIFF